MSPMQSNQSSVHSAHVAAMEESPDQTNQSILTTLPKNTKKAYKQKIEGFQQWCNDKFAHELSDKRYIVTGEKAYYFLDTAVVGRESRNKRRRTNGAEHTPAQIKKSTMLEQYGAALVHLWELQTQMGINSSPHPRNMFTELIQKVRREEKEEARKKADYEKNNKRGEGSMMDNSDTTTTGPAAPMTTTHYEFSPDGQPEVSAEAIESQEDAIFLQRYVPSIARKLADIENQHRVAYAKIEDMFKILSNNIADIASGSRANQINMDYNQGANSVSPSTPVQRSDSVFTLSNTVIDKDPAPQAPPTTTRSSSSTYTLSKSVHTVTDLYKEWTEGLDGNCSVVFMNAHHPGWYSNQKSFYMRRSRIIKACENHAAAEGISVEEAVEKAESLRIRNKKSLDYLSKHSNSIFNLL